MATQTQSSSGGIGFLGALTIAFIVLKLTGVIAWSWVWVLAPIWIPAAIIAVILAFVGVGFLIAYLLDKRKDNKRRKARVASRAVRDYGRSLDRR